MSKVESSQLCVYNHFISVYGELKSKMNLDLNNLEKRKPKPWY